MFGIDWRLQYFFSATIRWIRGRRSSGWPIVRGTVSTSASSGQTANVVYTYIALGERYTGEHTRRFWFADSAAKYAELFPPQTIVDIRYKPEHPEMSIMRSQDQGKRGTQLDGL